MTVDQQFNTLNEKMQHLVRHYARLHKENERLKEELETSRDREVQTRQKMDELQQQVSILKVATGDMTEKDRKDFEKKINQYIKEIDKCIAHLSQ